MEDDHLPKGFVYLSDIAPTIIQDLKYSTADNFIDHRLPGYEDSQCILTKKAAYALERLQRNLLKLGYSLA